MVTLNPSSPHPFPEAEDDALKKIMAGLPLIRASYRIGLEEVCERIELLRQSLDQDRDYNPIEHVKSRLKTPESIISKVHRRGYAWTLDSIRDNVRDIAGIRIACSFVSDIYQVSALLQKQPDILLVEYKDYIRTPKPNGYQSLHLILQVPVALSGHQEKVFVEVQIRTIAMDFWASLEHKIYYKYDKAVPQHLKDELKKAADTVAQLDNKMERIHQEMQQVKNSGSPSRP